MNGLDPGEVRRHRVDRLELVDEPRPRRRLTIAARRSGDSG